MKRLYVFFGLIASGKSYLASLFATRRQLAYFNTDRVRKELAGVTPTTSCASGVNQGIYSQEFSRRTYQALLERASARFAAGETEVVLDGSYSSRAARDQVRELAASLGASALFIYCQCPEEEVKRRLAERARDPGAVSDADWKIFQAQKSSFQLATELPAPSLITLDTNDTGENLLKTLERMLAHMDTASSN